MCSARFQDRNSDWCVSLASYLLEEGKCNGDPSLSPHEMLGVWGGRRVYLASSQVFSWGRNGT